MRVLLFLLLLLPGVARAERPHIAIIDILASDIVGRSTPGLGILIARHGRVIHIGGYGYADLASGRLVTADSLFDLASVSKQMTALAAAQQIAEGRYTEATPVARFLPALALAGDARPLTMGDLIHHLSGLPDYLSEDEGIDYRAETTNEEVIHWLSRQAPQSPPGARFAYSDSGYLVLGSAVTVADGAGSLNEVLRRRLWAPLGMDSTAVPLPRDPARRVVGYAGQGAVFEESAMDNAIEGDGNVFTSLNDLAKYEAGLADPAFLPPALAEVIFTNGRLDSGAPIRKDGEEGYGYGWSLSQRHGQHVASHLGGWRGTATLYVRNLTTGLTIILLANGEDADLWSLEEMLEKWLE